jgi:glutathione S-transferase
MLMLQPGFLRLNPNGRIPTLLDASQSPPFAVLETSAQLLYLLKEYDKEDTFGFKDEFERNEALQWLFFWHGKPHSILLWSSTDGRAQMKSLKMCTTTNTVTQQAEVPRTKAK